MIIEEDFLRPSEQARPMTKRQRTVAIVLHWTAMPNQSAQAVVRYWDTRPAGTYGSAHCVVDLDGTIYQALPWEEVGYHVGSSRGYTRLKEDIIGGDNPNRYTVGIEMCVENAEGHYTQATWDSALEVADFLLERYDLDTRHILTHKMIVGWKDCPRWFTENPSELELFRRQVGRV